MKQVIMEKDLQQSRSKASPSLDCSPVGDWRPANDAPMSSPCLVTDGERVEKARWMPRKRKWVFPHAKLRLVPTHWMPLPPPPGGDAKNPRCRDAIRLDWLADPDNRIGNVQLPVGAVIENVGSLRDAIDAAMSGDYERNAPLVEPGYLENDQVELPPNGGSESNSGAVGG